MLLRLLTGRVVDGREAAFLERCREVVGGTARTTGLIAFVGGYRRESGVERFVLLSAWSDVEAVRAGTGSANLDRSLAADRYAGVAEFDAAEHFEAVDDVSAGIVDTPGAILRIVRGRPAGGHAEAATAWLRGIRRANAPMLIGTFLGRKLRRGETEYLMATVWPDRLALEGAVGPEPEARALDDTDPDLFVDVVRSSWQVIELDLPTALQPLTTRRLLAARFPDPAAAERARSALAARFGAEAVAMADLGSTTYGGGRPAGWRLLTIRYDREDQGALERLVADLGGLVLTSRTDAAAAAAAKAAAAAADPDRGPLQPA